MTFSRLAHYWRAVVLIISMPTSVLKVPDQLVALNLRRVWVDMRVHVTEGKAPFLPSAEIHWLVSYPAN